MVLAKLLTSVYNGNFANVKTLVDQGADLRARTGKNDTALHLATLNGFVDIMEYLLEKDIGLLNMTNFNNETALYQAASRGNLAAVEALVNKGADLEIRNKYRNTPLHQAAGEGYIASQEGSVAVVELLIRRKACVTARNSNEETPLHRAALKGNSAAVAILVDAGADVLAKNKNGNTPLHQAAAEGHLSVIEKICSLVPESIDAKNGNDETPLYKALYSDNFSVIKALLKSGCDVNAKSKTGNTPLYLAVIKGDKNLAVIEELLEKNPYMYDKNNKGNTGAHHSAFNGNFKVLELLLRKGFCVDHLNGKGNTLLHLAAREGHTDVVNLLLDNKADLDIANQNGDSAVNLAARLGQTEIVLKLLKKGARPISVGNGQSVIHAASIGKRLHTIQSIFIELPAIVQECLNKTWNDSTEEEWASIVGCPHTTWWLHKKSMGTQQHKVNTTNKNWQSCKKRYETSGLNVIKRAKSNDKREGDWLYKSIMDSEIEMHFMDDDGNTALHAAVVSRRQYIEGKLREAGVLSIARNHRNQKPQETGGPVNYSEPKLPEMDKRTFSHLYTLLMTIISQTVCLDDTIADKAVQEKKLQVEKSVSSLLEKEIPLDPTGSNEKHLLHLAITSNNRTLLPILLAAGVPLTATESGLGIIQLAWLTPDLTTWVGMVVTRAVVNQLRVEQDIIGIQRANDTTSKELEALSLGISVLVKELNGERPFEAKWPETTRTTELLLSACEMGTTLTAWFIWQAGGNLFTRICGKRALEAAIAKGKFSTATRLILDMGANPFLMNSEKKMPVDQFPQDGYLFEVMFGQDYRCLDRLMEKSKDPGDKMELQQFILLLMVLVQQKKGRVNMDNWKPYFDMILELHSQNYVENGNWMSSLQKTLVKKGFESCDWNVCNEIRQIERGYDVDKSSGDFYSLFTTLEKNFEKPDARGNNHADHTNLLNRALRIACELKLPLFLHLLRMTTKLDVNTILNEECETRALHHAAKSGNISAVTYLLDWKASLWYKDRGGLLAVHYAYLYGHKSTGNYLLKQMKRASRGPADDRNSCGGEKLLPLDCMKHLCSLHNGQECMNDDKYDVEQSSLAFWQAYRHYLEHYKFDSHFNAESRYLHVRNDEELLRDSLDRIGKIWKQNGLRASVKEIAVDYQDEEAKAIQQGVRTFLKLLSVKIAQENVLFTGEPKFVGSSVDNVRLHCPDEYDCNLVMKNWCFECRLSDADNKEIGHEKSLKVSLSSSTPADEGLIELIQGSNYLTEFFKLVKTSLKELDFENADLKQLKLLIPGIKRTQVGVAFSFLWLGTKYPMLLVDVDFVPTVRAQWPKGLSKPKWVEREVRSLDEVFVNSVGKGEWRFSFGFLETKIMQKLTNEQREVFLACKIILSAFKTESWVPRSIKSKFTYWNGQMFSHSSKGGFALKNCFIRELEEITGNQEWENPLTRMRSVFSRMCKIYPKSDKGIGPSEEVIDPIPVKAYFGGEVETPAMYLIAPEILIFLRSLDDTIIDKQQ